MAESVTTSEATIRALGGGIKGHGFCQEHGIEHCWQPGPMLTTDPPIETRYCVNCGKRQQHRPGAWDDA